MQKRFITFVSSIAVISLLALAIVIFRLDPCLLPSEGGCEKASAFSLALFTSSGFFSLLGLFTLLGFFLRRQFQGEFFYDQMGISLRQGFLLAVTAVICLFLLLFGALTWWSGFLLIILMFLVELYFTARA